MHLNSRLIFQKYAASYFSQGNRVLEVGPDGNPSSFRKMISDPSITWDTVDIYSGYPHPLTYVATTPYSYPVAGDSYDVVLAANVLEHVPKPWLWLKELCRICRPGGYVITVNPVSWPFHEEPVDCWHVYPEGMRSLCAEAGLSVVLSQWESLECPGYRRYVPGVSVQYFGWARRLVCMHLLGRLGLPVERAYDTITVSRKEQV